ncbi:membrane protein [Sporolactobacillus laevolacticus]|uniref:Membrane protein n=1 Tax=Sporolactobacillus laevolacticus DSM 442 TaxID=1395513 RepID=V6IXR4_9BACL|nr:membrane protein [Sporolactobacillus laevolacticus]EST12120.1 membrane protein [Sporolactobacillus laevolacticus DSM 442]
MIDIMCLFQQSIRVEIVLSELQRLSVGQNDIACYVMNRPALQNRSNKGQLGNNDETSRADISFIIATIFGVVGASVGFRLAWGPIVWGVVSSFIGFLIGLVIDYFISNKFKKRPDPCVVIIIRCRKDQVSSVEQMLNKNQTLGLTIIES